MKQLTAILFLITLYFSAGAQQKKIDSLKKLAANTKDDTSKVMALAALGDAYSKSKPDSSAILADQAMQIAKDIRFLKGEMKAFTLLGNALSGTGNYPKALTAYLSALKLAESTGDRVQQVRVLSDIANIYSYEGDERKSLNFSLRTAISAKALGNNRMVAAVLSNLCDSYEKLNVLDSALFYGKQALQFAARVTPYDPDLTGTTLNNLGNTFSKLHKPDSALHYYRSGFPLIKQSRDNDAMSETAIGMAKIFRQLGMKDSSLYYARQSIATGWRGGITVRVFDASRFLTMYFKENGQIDSAFHYQEVLLVAKDSLYSQEKTKEFQDLVFSERQRQQDIQEQRVTTRAAIRFYLLMAVTIFLVIMAVVFWRNNRQNKKAKTQIQQTLDELKTTQNQLVQSAKMASLGELTAGIAHEIQNPLNFVNNFSDVNREMLEELKAESEKPKAEQDEQLQIELISDLIDNEEKINHHGKRADGIVKGMLQHSRASSTTKEPTDLNKLADEYLRLAYHGLRAKDKSFNADLVTHFDEGLPMISVVPQDIGRVLLNLFNNAFYATQQRVKAEGADYKPAVEVSTSAKDRQITMRVKDNGNGIPESIREKIMQPFFTTKPTGEGTGLGLSLSYDIVVKGHGGKIDLKSKDGEGSEFTVTLPL